MDAAASLRVARRRSGLSGRELARRAGTSAATLHGYEHGRTIPSVETLRRILAAAGFEADLVLSPRGGHEDHQAARALAVLELADAAPRRRRGPLAYPPIHRGTRP